MAVFAIVATLSAADMVQAAVVVIDDLEDPSPATVGNGGDANPFAPLAAPSNGAGGSRTFTVDWPTAGATIPLLNSALIGDGSVALSTFGGTPARVTFSYATMGGTDISDSGANDRFLFEFVTLDGGAIGTMSIDMSISTGSGVGTYAGDITESPVLPSQFYVPFASFSGTPDFSDVDSLTIIFNDDLITQVDFQISSPIVTTSESAPEPASVALLLIGLCVAGMTGRRRPQRMRKY